MRSPGESKERVVPKMGLELQTLGGWESRMGYGREGVAIQHMKGAVSEVGKKKQKTGEIRVSSQAKKELQERSDQLY